MQNNYSGGTSTFLSPSVTFFHPNLIGLKQVHWSPAWTSCSFSERVFDTWSLKNKTDAEPPLLSLFLVIFLFFSSQKTLVGLCFPCWPFCFPQWRPQYYVQASRFTMIVFEQNGGENWTNYNLHSNAAFLILKREVDINALTHSNVNQTRSLKQ